MIKAVIVDFDDTLCLTEAACFELENEILRRMGRQPMSREIHFQTWGQPLFEAIKTRSPGVDVDAFREIFATATIEWVESKRLDVITDANLTALDVLRKQGRQVFVLTSRTLTELEHIIAPGHDLAEHVTAFYHRDNMKYHKPDPRAFDQLLEEHNLQPQECVYVGDAITDAEAAKKAHMHFIACMEAGIRTREDFSGHEVDLFIGHFSELPTAVQTLENK